MGKPTGKKKSTVTPGAANSHPKQGKHSKAFDEDTAMFINMSQEFKEEGNKLFQKKDFEGAMLKYDKALKLLPKNHIDVAHLRTNMATCYMQLGIGEYPRAIHQCNLALQVSPRYSKALLKRATCYRALNRFDLALRDVNLVLGMEPNNLTALELLETLSKSTEEKGVSVDDKGVAFDTLHHSTPPSQRLKKKRAKKVEEKVGSGVVEDKQVDSKTVEETKLSVVEDKKVVSKTIEEEKVSGIEDKKVVSKAIEEEKRVVEPVEEENIVTRSVKLVFGEDIRWAELPVNCSVKLVRDIARDRFPGLKGVLVKYKDKEGDLVTITTTDELRLAEKSASEKVSFRLYIAEVNLDEEPSYDGTSTTNGDEVLRGSRKLSDGVENGGMEEGKDKDKRMITVEDWLLQFARLFKNHVGFESDSYLDTHEFAMKLYQEAMEDTVASNDAQELFEIAADKFQEMAALALFNWGSVQMSRARNRSFLSEDGARESSLEHIKAAYELAQKEYKNAEMRYEEALKIKPDFYEGYLALGHQQFEQARLCWSYAMACKMDLESGFSEEVLRLYNKAEDSMEKGILMWEEMEEQRLNGISKSDKYKEQLEKMGLDSVFKDVSDDEVSKQAAKMRSEIHLLWGTLLYERSVMEYKLGLPTWEECLEVAVEKFELAGTSTTDIAVIVKNHCSNETALEGFKIDEIVQAWNEMYDARGWQFGDPSFRLEPLFRRRVPKLHDILEQF